MRARAAHGRRPCRAVAGLGLEPESGSRSGTTPTGGPRLLASEKGEERAGVRWAGERSWAGWAARGGKKKEKASWAGPCGRKEGKRKARLC
jgi:hypothetical protein